MTKPTITHLTAADGAELVVTTAIRGGLLQIKVFSAKHKDRPCIMAGEFTAQESVNARKPRGA